MRRLTKRDQTIHIFMIVLREVYICINVILMLFPLIYMIIASGKSQMQLMQEPFQIPAGLVQFKENYTAVITGIKYFYGKAVQFYTPYFIMILNSSILTVVALVFLIVCAAPIGYVLGARNFRFKKQLMLFIILIQTVPLFGYLVSFYFLMNSWGMTNSRIGISLIYASVSMPSSIIYLRGFYASFPKEIEEAAKIDGAGEVHRYFGIVIPISKSILVAIILINFMGYWNEYAITNIFTTKTQLQTVSINLMKADTSDYTYSMALLVLSAIPTFLFFTIFQKQIINSSLTMGSLKG